MRRTAKRRNKDAAMRLKEMERAMKASSTKIATLGIAMFLAACASGEVTNKQSVAEQIVLEKPGRIIVYDIAATASDVPPSSTMTGHYQQHSEAQTAKEIQEGRQLGAQVASLLVQELKKNGIYAERAGQGLPARQGDVLVSGQFFAIDEGSRTRRVVIGFGKGASELQTHVEAYLLTPQGHRLIATQSIDAGGGKMPGLALPGAMAVVTGSPVGLVVGGVMTIKRERGSETMSGGASRTAAAVADQIKSFYQSHGWL